jgi:hypothetical protein
MRNESATEYINVCTRSRIVAHLLAWHRVPQRSPVVCLPLSESCETSVELITRLTLEATPLCDCFRRKEEEKKKRTFYNDSVNNVSRVSRFLCICKPGALSISLDRSMRRTSPDLPMYRYASYAYGMSTEIPEGRYTYLQNGRERPVDYVTGNLAGTHS